MEKTTSKIKKVKLYSCGCCVNQLSHVFRGHKAEKRVFPALSVYIEHEEYGNILFDTGYSDLIYKNGLVSKIYNTLNKTYVTDSDRIDIKLKNDGIAPESIRCIILSHAHPDHIAGLIFFDNYELISTAKVINTMFTGNAFDLVFKNMVPQKRPEMRAVKKHQEGTVFDGYFKTVYDIFPDGSMLGVDLSGHADGQMGLYLPEYKLFFAADACWGEDLLSQTVNMRFIPRLIQDSYKKYLSCTDSLARFGKDHPEIRIIYSHGGTEEKCYEQ